MREMPDLLDEMELSELIQDLEEDVITPERRGELMAQLRFHAAARELYLKHFKLAALLRQTAETRGELGTIPVSEEMLRRARRQSAWSAVGWGVAAVLLVALGLMLFQIQVKFEGGSAEIAIRGSQDASYRLDPSGDGNSRKKDSLRPGDRISLEGGLLRLEFPSKVEALIEGPCELEVISGSEIRVEGGMSWFRVPEAGRGFAVRTERARVVDLGTEFGLWFDDEGHMQVHVSEGKVRVEPTFSGASEFEIREGEARRIDGKGAGLAVGLREGLFRREFSHQVPYLHWSFDHLFDGKFPATGSMAKGGRYAAELRRMGGELTEEDLAESRTDGVRGKAFAMRGQGLYAETDFPGIAGNTPRTVAAWVRHRGREAKFQAFGSEHQLDDPYSGYGATTPFGEQAYLFDYGGLALTTAEGAIGKLEAGMIYGLDFHVAARPGVPNANYRVELVAFGSEEGDKFQRQGGNQGSGSVLAVATGLAEASDMSESSGIEFTAAADNPNLGKDLAIRLVQVGGLVRSHGQRRHSGRVLYDNLRLTARAAGEDDLRMIFSEDFEEPRVAGFARGSSPGEAWVRSGNKGHQGLFNHHPPYASPYFSWGRRAPGELWAGFVDDFSAPRWSLGTGRFWTSSEESGKISEGRWVHVATVYTGETTAEGLPEIIHYVDGERLESRYAGSLARGSVDPVATETGSQDGANLHFGLLPGADAPALNGDLDEFFIFRGALDGDEIRKLMETHTPQFLRK